MATTGCQYRDHSDNCNDDYVLHISCHSLFLKAILFMYF